MKKWIKAINVRNRKLGVLTTKAVGNMWTAYLFTVWSVLPLAIPKLTIIVQYVSQDVIQLVLLSVIMVGQDVASALSEERHFTMLNKLDSIVSDIDEKVTKELQLAHSETAELRQIIENQATMIASQSDLMAEMEEVISDLHQIASELHDSHIGGREHYRRK